MNVPKVQTAQALDDRTLLIEFDNQQKKKYDITPLLENDMFSPLKNPAFFKAVRVEQGGYAVVWNENIDISEFELWENGEELQCIK